MTAAASGAATSPSSSAGSLSWAAATWAAPVVPGLALAVVLRLGGADETALRLVGASVLLVLLLAGTTAIFMSRRPVLRGAGLGLAAGAALTAVLALGVGR